MMKKALIELNIGSLLSKSIEKIKVNKIALEQKPNSKQTKAR